MRRESSQDKDENGMRSARGQDQPRAQGWKGGKKAKENNKQHDASDRMGWDGMGWPIPDGTGQDGVEGNGTSLLTFMK